MESTELIEKSRTAVNFTPYPGTIALLLPTEVYPSTSMFLSKEQYLKQIDDKAEAAATGELVIAAIGDGVEFVKIGDIVSLQNRTRIQKLIIDSGVPDKPTVFWIVREAEVLCKHDKDFN
tara:strand:+ start:839 stop:1198 length:360 start_codon:yes stop_codon:yes gene_type:complete